MTERRKGESERRTYPKKRRLCLMFIEFGLMFLLCLYSERDLSELFTPTYEPYINVTLRRKEAQSREGTIIFISIIVLAALSVTYTLYGEMSILVGEKLRDEKPNYIQFLIEKKLRLIG